MDINGHTLSAMTRYFDGKAGAFAYLLFVLIYAPCVAAVGAIFKETSFKWAAFAVFYLTLLAWVVSTLFYQACNWLAEREDLLSIPPKILSETPILV